MSKQDRVDKICAFVWGGAIGFIVAFWGIVGYTLYHFITKYW